MTSRRSCEPQRKPSTSRNLIHPSEATPGVIAKSAVFVLFVFLFSALLVGNAIAQERENEPAAEESSPAREFNHSINMCPGGIIFGVYSFNYEYLIGQTHGLVARFDYESVDESFSDDTMEGSGLGVTLNYRWHLNEAMESLFIGPYVRYRVYDGTGTSGETPFEYTLPEWTVGLNAGHRWVWSSGINLTAAFGYGFSDLSKETDPSSPSIDETLNKFEDESSFLGPFYGELSIGYAF